MRPTRPAPADPSRVRAILRAAHEHDELAHDDDGTAGPSAAERAAAEPPVAERPPTPGEVERMLRRARRPALFTVPQPIRTARVQLGGVVVVAVLALALALGALWAVRVLWADRPGQAVSTPGSLRPMPVSMTSAVGDAGPADPAGPSPPLPGQPAAPDAESPAGASAGPARSPSGPGSPGVVVVHITGAVARPGLVSLPAGSRVADAVSAAGGQTPAADLESVNLARVLTDSEQVHVAAVGEAPRPQPTGGAGVGTAASGGAVSSGPSQRVELNSADAAALDGLPGVGPVLAQRIIDWRTQHGRFSSVQELGEVSGIGDKLLATLQPLVVVDR